MSHFPAKFLFLLISFSRLGNFRNLITIRSAQSKQDVKAFIFDISARNNDAAPTLPQALQCHKHST
jgi:hypothetical protein